MTTRYLVRVYDAADVLMWERAVVATQVFDPKAPGGVRLDLAADDARALLPYFASMRDKRARAEWSALGEPVPDPLAAVRGQP